MKKISANVCFDCSVTIIITCTNIFINVIVLNVIHVVHVYTPSRHLLENNVWNSYLKCCAGIQPVSVNTDDPVALMRYLVANGAYTRSFCKP